MVSFSILLFFAVTGLTLNHQSWFNGEPQARRFTGTLDLALVNPPAGRDVARLQIVEALRKAHGIKASLKDVRVEDTEIDYNGPVAPDPFTCVNNLELVPPEGTTLCGNDPGEPNYSGFGVFNPRGYSTPVIRNVASPAATVPAGARLFDPTRGVIRPRNPVTGAGGLRKPSLRVPAVGGRPNRPNYLVNTDPNDVTPSNENDYVRDRNVAAALGKSLFWDMQVGSDGVQSCGTCHFTGAGIDTRTRNQINPNHLGPDGFNAAFDLMAPNQRDLTAADFPLHKLKNPDVAGDPKCMPAIVANVSAVPAMDHPVAGAQVVCDATNIERDVFERKKLVVLHASLQRANRIFLESIDSLVSDAVPNRNVLDVNYRSMLGLNRLTHLCG